MVTCQRIRGPDKTWRAAWLARRASSAIRAELAAKAGPPKTVKGGARKLDLAALNVTSVAGARAAGQRTMDNSKPAGPKTLPVSQKTTATSPLRAALAGSLERKDALASNSTASAYAEAKCLDKGPPVISEVEGRLKPGGKLIVWGTCFGERPGQVEIIGQFPGGKLTSAFTAWDNTAVELEIAANIRGATDHVVAVTVVTADGKRSPAMQGQFIAAREHVEVPARLWSPGADFDFAATAETSKLVDSYKVNAAYSGHTAKTLRIQPQCGLDTMDATVLSGGITQISGWEQGPPNEASVTIDWVGTCTGTKTTTNYNYIVVQGSGDVSIRSACRVAFQARAWAYCPAGIAP